MVRAALNPNPRIGKGPPAYARYVPALSIVGASLLAVLPIVSAHGWYPDFGFLMLLAWRLLRADPFPAWWSAPLGFVNDLFSGYPLGFSVALWSLSMFLLEIADRRTMWRDYWIEWVLAAVLIALHQLFLWFVVGWSGAAVSIETMAPGFVISIFAFPLAAFFAAYLDRKRLAR